MEEKINLKQLETPKYNKHPHSLLLRKLSSSTTNKNVIKSEISEYFNSPDKFFNPNSNIVINRKINLKKIIHIEENKPSAHKTFGRRDSFRSNKNNTSKLSYLKEKNSIYNKFSLDYFHCFYNFLNFFFIIFFYLSYFINILISET